MSVVEESSNQEVGSLSGILIHPDSGAIEGFFVEVSHSFSSAHLFLSVFDIRRFATRVYVRSVDVLSPAEDRIRLESLLNDPRTVLGQKMKVESGRVLGNCSDVQFDTEAMHIEWLFPKKWFRYGMAVPVTDILEVKKGYILLRDPLKKQKQQECEPNKEEVASPLPDLPETITGRIQ